MAATHSYTDEFDNFIATRYNTEISKIRDSISKGNFEPVLKQTTDLLIEFITKARAAIFTDPEIRKEDIYPEYPGNFKRIRDIYTKFSLLIMGVEDNYRQGNYDAIIDLVGISNDTGNCLTALQAATNFAIRAYADPEITTKDIKQSASDFNRYLTDLEKTINSFSAMEEQPRKKETESGTGTLRKRFSIRIGASAVTEGNQERDNFLQLLKHYVIYAIRNGKKDDKLIRTILKDLEKRIRKILEKNPEFIEYISSHLLDMAAGQELLKAEAVKKHINKALSKLDDMSLDKMQVYAHMALLLNPDKKPKDVIKFKEKKNLHGFIASLSSPVIAGYLLMEYKKNTGNSLLGEALNEKEAYKVSLKATCTKAATQIFTHAKDHKKDKLVPDNIEMNAIKCIMWLLSFPPTERFTKMPVFSAINYVAVRSPLIQKFCIDFLPEIQDKRLVEQKIEDSNLGRNIKDSLIEFSEISWEARKRINEKLTIRQEPEMESLKRLVSAEESRLSGGVTVDI